MRIAGLIVAAGRGSRVGGAVPKQYQPIGDVSILRRTIDAFLSCTHITELIAVISPDDQAQYDAALADLRDNRLLPPTPGGAARHTSVRAGLEALSSSAPDLVLIHDAARPFTSGSLIERVLDALQTVPAAFPAIPIVDALWKGRGDIVEASVERSDLWRAQTPQGFHFDAILDAHRAYDGKAADDVEIAHAAGLPVKIVMGDGNNFKITLPEDFARAERLLKA